MTRLGAWLGLIGLAAQLLLLIVPVPRSGPDGIVICTPSGMVTLDAQDAPGDGDQASPRPCPLCRLPQFAAILPPPAGPVAPIEPATVCRLSAVPPLDAPARPKTPNQPRAPPTPV